MTDATTKATLRGAYNRFEQLQALAQNQSNLDKIVIYDKGFRVHRRNVFLAKFREGAAERLALQKIRAVNRIIDDLKTVDPAYGHTSEINYKIPEITLRQAINLNDYKKLVEKVNNDVSLFSVKYDLYYNPLQEDDLQQKEEKQEIEQNSSKNSLQKENKHGAPVKSKLEMFDHVTNIHVGGSGSNLVADHGVTEIDVPSW